MSNGTAEAGSQPTAGRARRRKKRIIIPAIVIVGVAAAAVFYWYHYLRGFVSTDDAVIDCDAVTISSKILGRIVTLQADEGDSVAAGTLLVQLDDSDLRAQEVEAEASLEFMEQNVRIARIALARARDDFSRDSIQFGQHAIPREQFDHTRNKLDMAQAELAAATSHVGAARAKLGVIETQLESTRISTYGPGVVARKWVVPGDIAQPGQPLFTLFDLHDVWVTANLEETKIAAIHPGSSVEIRVDAYPGRVFAGRVERIGSAAASQFALIPPNNASGNFTKVTQRVPVKIVFAGAKSGDPENRPVLVPGMSVGVRVRTTDD